MGYQGLWSRPGCSPSARPGLTRGTGKPLRLTPGVQPKGSEKPSSYSAGSQRTKARLEAPSVGLRLQGRKYRALTPVGRVPSLQTPPVEDQPLAATPVIALPGDGSVLVLLWAGHPQVLVGAATCLGQQVQLGRGQHVCGPGKGGGKWVLSPSFLPTAGEPCLGDVV